MTNKVTLNDLSKDLNQILTFKPETFNGKTKTEQATYSIILSFARFYNDLRDLEILKKLINQDESEIAQTNNPLYGQNGGINTFILRLFFGFVYEFINLIQKNLDILKSTEFTKIIQNIDKNTKADFEKLVNFSSDKDSHMFKVLAQLRGNLAFHYYQPKELYNGYQFATQTCLRSVYVSMGTSMKQTRYYFTDMALQTSIYSTIIKEFESIEEWNKELDVLIDSILRSTMVIVRQFLCMNDAPKPASDEEIPSVEYLINEIKNASKSE